MIKAIIISIVVVVLLGTAFLFHNYSLERITDVPEHVFTSESGPTEELESAHAVTTYITGRSVIWAMDFLPDGRMVFTERNGTVNLVAADGQVTQILNIDVEATGESGLHGVAIEPDFENNRFVYLYYTYKTEGADTANRVSRYAFEGNLLKGEEIIVDNIPGATTHDGGRLKFGPDGFLYITTGDAQTPSLSADRNYLAGKILRITRDGEVAPGNPFNNLVYSYGHRNPQGITWDSEGRLWSTEHGPSTKDELNLIEAGINYGWPDITGTDTREGMRAPIIQSGASTWAPAGATHYADSIFFTGLRGNALYEYNIETEILTTHAKNRFGRIRDVVLGPDGFLYIATSNRDGRGFPSSEDDRILKINPLKLGEI